MSLSALRIRHSYTAEEIDIGGRYLASAALPPPESRHEQ